MNFVDESDVLQKFGLELNLVDPETGTLQTVVEDPGDVRRMIISFSEVTRSLSVHLFEDEAVNFVFESENLAKLVIYDTKEESGLKADFTIQGVRATAEIVIAPRPVLRFYSLAC